MIFHRTRTETITFSLVVLTHYSPTDDQHVTQSNVDQSDPSNRIEGSLQSPEAERAEPGTLSNRKHGSEWLVTRNLPLQSESCRSPSNLTSEFYEVLQTGTTSGVLDVTDPIAQLERLPIEEVSCGISVRFMVSAMESSASLPIAVLCQFADATPRASAGIGTCNSICRECTPR